MIDSMNISDESDLIDQNLKEQLADIFKKLESPVIMKAMVDITRQKDRQMAIFLKAIAALSEKLTLELYAPEEQDQVPELDPKYLPVTGLYQAGGYGRCAFHGIPGGKEINSFMLAIYNLAGPGQNVAGGLKRKIARLNQKTNIKICVSLSCHHCPKVVAACQQIAILNPHIEAEMIDAALYSDLVDEYQIERVPMMIVNDNEIHMGNKTIEEIVALLNN